MTVPEGAQRRTPNEWASHLLGENARFLVHDEASSLATGTIDSTRVCVHVEMSLLSANTADAAAFALRALEIARLTGCLLITVLVDGGTHFAEPDLGRWLRDAHRLSGIVPHLALTIGATTPQAILRRASADLCLHVDDSAEASSADEAIARMRALAALLPENNATPAPMGSRYEPETVSLELPPATAQDIVDAVADAPVLVLRGGGLITSIGRIDGQTLVTVATSADAAPDADDIAAAARVLAFCDAFHVPVLFVVDSAGAPEDPTAALPLVRALADSATPVITVVTGRAVGPLSILANTQLGVREVIAWPHAQIGEHGIHRLVDAQRPTTDAERAAALAASYRHSATRVAGADRVIAPTDTLLDIHAALERWALIDEPTLARRREIPVR